MPLRVGLVAGEASGDTLGAGLIYALRRLAPDAEFFGVAGPKMRGGGCGAWEPGQSLAVRGPFRSLGGFARLVRFLGLLRRSVLPARPPVFVGIDATHTNLRLRLGGRPSSLSRRWRTPMSRAFSPRRSNGSRRASRCDCSTDVRRPFSSQRTWCWWLREPRVWKRRCASVRWWWSIVWVP